MHCSFRKMVEYWRNLRGILAKTARPAEILGLNGPAQLAFGPDRPGPVHLNLRPGPAQFVKPEIYNPGRDSPAGFRHGPVCPAGQPNLNPGIAGLNGICVP